MELLYHRFVLRVNGLGFDEQVGIQELHETFIEAIYQLGTTFERTIYGQVSVLLDGGFLCGTDVFKVQVLKAYEIFVSIIFNYEIAT
ncbi:hypothetical protein YC2023_045843 [Brassica napus]